MVHPSSNPPSPRVKEEGYEMKTQEGEEEEEEEMMIVMRTLPLRILTRPSRP